MSKRKCITLAQKLEILSKVDEGKTSKSEIGRQYQLSSSSLFTILKNRDKIENAVFRESKPTQHKRLRTAQHADLEKVLFEWFAQQRAKGIPISGPMLQAKADELALKMNKEFKCSNGWLNRFKVRMGISCHKINGEANSVNPEHIEEWKPVLKNILKRYEPKDVYNADESALYYNLLPDKTLAVKEDKCIGAKRSKERLTFLLCTNMDGSDKMKPFMIGKSKNPRCFGKHILPCTYEANSKAWMTGTLFVQWLKAFDARMGAANRKVALFIDNCSAHPRVELRNIELIFFPPNTTSKLQPLDQGVICLVKRRFRAMLVNAIVRQLSNSAQDVSIKKWNVLDAMRGIATSWKAVPSNSIAACFRHAHFVKPAVEDSEEDVEEDDEIEDNFEDEVEDDYDVEEPVSWSTVADKLGANCTFDDYVNIDSEAMVCEEIDDEGLINAASETGNESDEGESDDDSTPTFPKLEEILKALNVIDSMYKSLDSTPEELLTFHSVENYCLSNARKQKQTTITSFFKPSRSRVM